MWIRDRPRKGFRAYSRCGIIDRWIWSRRILYRYFFPNQPQPTLELYESSIKAAAVWQRRDSIRGWLHHLRRSVAVRSDAWIMVMLPHLDCIQRNEFSRRAFVARYFTSCTTLSGIIKTGSVFMPTPKRLLHFWTLVRERRVYVCTCYVSFILYVDTTTAAAAWYSYI